MRYLIASLIYVASQGVSSTPTRQQRAPSDTQATEAKPTEANQPESFWQHTRHDPVAFFTLWLTVFTGVLAASTIGLWLSNRNTIEQMQRDFAAANRPRVRLRRIYFAGTDPLPMTRTGDEMGGYRISRPAGAAPPRVVIEMTNVGGVGVAKASLRVSFIIFNTGQPQPGRIQHELAMALPQEIEVSPAGSGVLVVEVAAVASLFYDSNVQSGGQSVYCVGYTEYADEGGTLIGRTGFIRRCDIRNKWFERVDFPDFEYAD